jgi:hypothetical protein
VSCPSNSLHNLLTLGLIQMLIHFVGYLRDATLGAL